MINIMIKKKLTIHVADSFLIKKLIDIDFQRVFVLIFIQNMILVSFDFEVYMIYICMFFFTCVYIYIYIYIYICPVLFVIHENLQLRISPITNKCKDYVKMIISIVHIGHFPGPDFCLYLRLFCSLHLGFQKKITDVIIVFIKSLIILNCITIEVLIGGYQDIVLNS